MASTERAWRTRTGPSTPRHAHGRAVRGPALRIGAETVRNYLQLLGGSVARLGLSLCYFLVLTRALSLADFGFFASAVAVGTVLARLVAFGYGANLFQVSATRPRTIGHYYGIYLVWLAGSLPVCLGLASLVYAAAFSRADEFGAYLMAVTAEVVLWRTLDMVSTVNSGLGRFGLAAAAYNIGTAMRALAALAFLLSGRHGVEAWAALYLLANAGALAIVVAGTSPRVRPRVRRRALLVRWRAAIALGGAGLATALEAEIDKVLVLTLGGETTAGLYAICIRVIDLTAVPIRAFNVIMIQRVFKNPRSLSGWRAQAAAEVAVAGVSTAAYLALALALRIAPNLLGRDVTRAAGLLGLLWAVPALRNLIEYQAELLYAHARMTATFWIALALTIVKAAALALVFAILGQQQGWVAPMNLVFLVTYLASAALTYATLRRPPRRTVARDAA